MSLISVRSDLRGAARDVKKMQGVIQKAATSSINRATSQARTAGVRKVRERYEIRAKEVNATFSVRKATSNGLAAILKSKTQGGLPLIKFKTAPKSPMAPNQPRGGVKATVLKGQKRTLKRAFVASVGSGGHIGVFERSTTRRLPIKELFGPPIPYMLNNPEVRDEIEQKFAESFESRFSHEVDRQLGKLVR